MKFGRDKFKFGFYFLLRDSYSLHFGPGFLLFIGLAFLSDVAGVNFGLNSSSDFFP
jgi:hypothetical protein